MNHDCTVEICRWSPEKESRVQSGEKDNVVIELL
jgi:hypothetical protein